MTRRQAEAIFSSPPWRCEPIVAGRGLQVVDLRPAQPSSSSAAPPKLTPSAGSVARPEESTTNSEHRRVLLHSQFEIIGHPHRDRGKLELVRKAGEQPEGLA